MPTLIALIRVAYEADPADYSDRPMTAEELAAADQRSVDDGGITVRDILDWAASGRDVAVRIRPEAAERPSGPFTDGL